MHVGDSGTVLDGSSMMADNSRCSLASINELYSKPMGPSSAPTRSAYSTRDRAFLAIDSPLLNEGAVGPPVRLEVPKSGMHSLWVLPFRLSLAFLSALRVVELSRHDWGCVAAAVISAKVRVMSTFFGPRS